MKRGFLKKLLDRVGRLSPEDVQQYLLHLARERGFFESIFDALQEGVVVTDARGRIIYLNGAVGRMFGVETEGCEGKPLGDRIPGLDWGALVDAGRLVTRDLELRYPEVRHVNFYMTPVRGGERGELLGYAIIFRDLTEARRATLEEIESEKISALTMLAAGVAHEIGNPLNSLHIHLQLLERRLRRLEPEARKGLEETVRVARAEIDRLDLIVTQFLRAIRPARLDLAMGDLNELVREAVDFLSAEGVDRGIEIRLELRSDLAPIRIDRNQMKQAFYNLMRNAFQAMSKEGRLTVRTDRDGPFLSVRFTDTGGGITAGNLGRVFQPYFTTKAAGSGLGLHIVRRIVRDHGGEIEIDSVEGEGTTVTILLPTEDRRVRLLEDGPADGLGEIADSRLAIGDSQ